MTAEGVVTTYQSTDGKLGAVIEVNCETDFVAKNDDFLAFAKSLAERKMAGAVSREGRFLFHVVAQHVGREWLTVEEDS